MDEYWNIFEEDNEICSVDNLLLKFYKFENADKFFQFLGLSFPNSLVALNTEDENSSDSDPAVTSNFVSPQDIKKTFSSMKIFSITIFDDIFPSISEMKSFIKKEDLSQTFKEILNQFSPDSQRCILENIKKIFSKSVLAETINEVEQNSSANNDIFSKYQEKLNELFNSGDRRFKCKIDSEYNILRSLLLTLFLEKISQKILQNLPVNLQEIHLSVFVQYSPLLSIANLIGNLTQLEKIELSNDNCFYESSDFIQFLSSLPKCQNLVLKDTKLSHLFIEFVKKNLTENVDESPIPIEASVNVTFPSLDSLSLFLHPKESFTTVEIQSIAKLPVLRSLKVNNLPDDLLHDDKLKKVINKSTLLNVDLSWKLDYCQKSINDNRESSDVPFDCEFDFKVIMQSKISELEKSIQGLTKDDDKYLRMDEEIMKLKASLTAEYILEIIYLLNVYFSHSNDKKIKSTLDFMHTEITSTLHKRITIAVLYNGARNSSNQNENRLNPYHEDMISARDNFKKALCETIAELKKLLFKNISSQSQTRSMIESKIDNFEKKYAAEMGNSQE